MRVSLFFLLPAVLLFLTAIYAEEEKTTDDQSKTPLEIGFFDAIEQEKIEAKIVANNSMSGRVTVKNTSGVPLRVKLPETFAAVPIAQFGDMGDGGGGGGRGGRGGGSSRGSGSGGGNQSSGGGMSGMGGMGGGGGGWNIPPEKIVRQDVKTVCLEHGKKEPNRHVNYEMRPLESVTDKPEVHAICALVGAGAVNQDAAQAAVWHYNNGMSWEELANKRIKPRIDAMNTVPYFSREQMLYAMNLGKQVEEKIAKEAKEKKEANKEKSSSSYSND